MCVCALASRCGVYSAATRVKRPDVLGPLVHGSLSEVYLDRQRLDDLRRLALPVSRAPPAVRVSVSASASVKVLHSGNLHSTWQEVASLTLYELALENYRPSAFAKTLRP